MGFLGFGKKREVPDELPDLISDEIEKESKVNDNFIKNKEDGLKAEKLKNLEEERKEIEKNNALIEEEKKKEREKHEDKRRKTEMLNKLIKSVEDTPQREEKKDDFDSDKSFFDELQNNIKQELSELEDLSDFNEKSFTQKNFLDDMKDFWEKQKKFSILDSLSKDMEEKIVSKISILKSLEKEWQSVYFKLVEKEEEIKDGEKELKAILKEFSKVCKHKKEAMSNEKRKNNEKKN